MLTCDFTCDLKRGSKQVHIKLDVFLNCSLLNRTKQTLMNDVERIMIVEFFFAFECRIII
jgi:hypothetical protein